MIQTTYRAALAVLSVLTLSTNLHAAEALRILNWEEYLADDVIEQWQAETGIAIEQVYFDSDEMRDQILNTAQSNNFDLAMMDQLIIPHFGNKGTILSIQREKIPNLKHIPARELKSCSQYGLPYAWGTVGIIYRSDKVSRPESWRALLQPDAELHGHISMLYDYLDTLIPPLLLNNQDFMTEDQASLKSAFSLLKEQAPHLLTLQYPITFIRNAPNAEALYMGMAYSGDQYTINEMIGEEELWKFTVPQEGGAIWRDCLTVMADSKMKDQAYAFINFLNRPEIAALNAESLYVAPSNQAALPLLSTEFLEDEEVFPTPEILARSRDYRPISSSSVTLRKRITGAVRKIHEAK